MVQNRCVATLAVLVLTLLALLPGCLVPKDVGIVLVAIPEALDFGADKSLLTLAVTKNVTSTPLTAPVVVLSNQPWLKPVTCTNGGDGCAIETINDRLNIPIRIDRTLMHLGNNTGKLTLRTGVASDVEVLVVAEDILQTDFTVDNQVPAPNEAVTFTDASITTSAAGPILGRLWEFGDGTTSTATNPVHRYQQPGYYKVSLTVTTTGDAETRTKPAYISVGTPPVGVDFVASDTVVFEGDGVTFVDISNLGSAVVSRLWDFGVPNTDTDTSTEESPTYQYATSGIYTVSLTVTTSAGINTKVKTGLIVVKKAIAPFADFAIVGGTTVPAQQVVQFTDKSLPGTAPIQWLWDFGDGAASTEQNPSHAFADAGTYTVTLTVVSDHGVSTATKQITVVTTPPAAAFTIAPEPYFIETPIQFADASTPGTGTKLTWRWDFDDGDTSALQSPEHEYATPGDYTVTLTVSTTHGQDSASQTIHVDYMPPAANFTANKTKAATGEQVQFTDSSTNGTEPINQWAWDFGDGGTSTLRNPVHAYANPGIYDVSLTVTIPLGSNNSDTLVRTGYISVAKPPVPAFDVDSRGASTSRDVQFINMTVPGSEAAINYLWTFGDGQTSTQANPSHRYTAPGQVTAKLQVSTAITPARTASLLLTVDQAPTPGFSGTPTTALVNEAVQFTDESVDEGARPIAQRLWRFGDNAVSTSINPAHTYTAAARYTVSLEVRFRHSVTNELVPVTVSKSNYIRVIDRDIEVDTASDVADGDVSSVRALAADRGADNRVSLREAILAANNTPGEDKITFDRSRNLNITQALPALSDATGGTTIIGVGSTLNGSTLAGSENGLQISSPMNTIQDLTITGFPGSGIRIAGLGARDTLIGSPTDLTLANIITANGTYGISITGVNSVRNQIRGNSISGNGDAGIVLQNGANEGMPAPVITAIEPVRGTAEPGAEVEIFIDNDDEGLQYLETVTADASGNFEGIVTLQGTTLPSPAAITATATDGVGNSSEFSAPFVVALPLPPFTPTPPAR